jgi:hypothetical protein
VAASAFASSSDSSTAYPSTPANRT